MTRTVSIRIAGAVLTFVGGVMSVGYVWIALDTPRIIRQASTELPLHLLVNLSALIVLHFLGFAAGIGLLLLRRWARVAAVAYLAGLLLHGTLWLLQRPRLDETMLELLLLTVVLCVVSWLLFRADNSALFRQP